MTISSCYFDGSEPKFFDVVIEYPHQCLLLIISNDWKHVDAVVMGVAYLINAMSSLVNSYKSK